MVKRMLSFPAIAALAFSLSVVLLEEVDMTPFLYATETGASIVLAPVAAGTVRGLLYVAALSLNGAAGGESILYLPCSSIKSRILI